MSEQQEGIIEMSWGKGYYRYEVPGGMGPSPTIVVIRDADGYVRVVMDPGDFEQMKRKAGAR